MYDPPVTILKTKSDSSILHDSIGYERYEISFALINSLKIVFIEESKMNLRSEMSYWPTEYIPSAIKVKIRNINITFNIRQRPHFLLNR